MQAKERTERKIKKDRVKRMKDWGGGKLLDCYTLRGNQNGSKKTRNAVNCCT
jgi:hypothetical protein